MKKKLILLLVLALAMLAFVGCGGDADNGGNDVDVDDNGGDEVVGGEVKTGLAVITGIPFSADAGDRDGVAQADSTVVAVTVDENGVILNVALDHAMTTMNFDAEGKIVTPRDTVFLGKQELGDDYGMRVASPIGREWNEQADDLCKYVIGKTVEEIKGIALNDAGEPTDDDLTSSVTVIITGYIAAIEKAVANAQALGASATDKVGIGLVTTMDQYDSKDATADENGKAIAYTYYAGITFDDNGVITSAIIDASQTGIEFSNDGTMLTAKDTVFKTKNELGADYGMIVASSIDKEWNEQAAAFADYVVGKTVADVKGIAVTDGGTAADEDLASSVTVGVTSFITIIEKAFNFAK